MNKNRCKITDYGKTKFKRLRVKLNQVQKSSNKELPSYIIVVEFGKPKAKIVKDETTL